MFILDTTRLVSTSLRRLKCRASTCLPDSARDECLTVGARLEGEKSACFRLRCRAALLLHGSWLRKCWVMRWRCCRARSEGSLDYRFQLGLPFAGLLCGVLSNISQKSAAFVNEYRARVSCSLPRTS